MKQYYVQWWTERMYGVGVDGYGNTVVLANDDIEAKSLVEKTYNVEVMHIDVRWVMHPLSINNVVEIKGSRNEWLLDVSGHPDTPITFDQTETIMARPVNIPK